MTGSDGDASAGMIGRFVAETPGGIRVRVTDAADRDHDVLVGPDGEILSHDSPAFVPPTERTEQQEEVYRQIYNQAFQTAHDQTEYDIVPSMWRTEVLERGVAALESCPPDQFEAFEEYYRALSEPTEFVDLPRERVHIVFQPVRLGENGRIEVGSLRFNVEIEKGTAVWKGPDEPLDFALHLPTHTFEWPFGERFREFLVHHLRCQIRDTYVNRGEVPPERYQIDGFGKVNFAGDELDSEGR